LFTANTSQPHSNLTVFHRSALPFGRFEVVRNFDLKRNANFLRRWLDSHGFRRTLLWHSTPYWSEPIVDAIAPQWFAYHCLDTTRRVEEEARLVRKADAVFCVSTTLAQKYSALNANTHWLPNGVNLELFDPAKAESARRPEDLPTGGRLIGFIGALNYHLDLELLVQVAQSFPQDYVIVGGKQLGSATAPQGEQLRALAQLGTLKNARMLGFVPTSEMPAYLNAFDVCLIPFIQNKFNEECDPLKFYQYAAMGRPIVTTPVTVAKNFPDLAYIASSREEFIAQVAEVLRGTEPEGLRQKRIEFARAHAWPAIVSKALRILENTTGNKGTKSQKVGA
jgi:glycosyltransferase involved in cell wall biosynthesis